MERIEILDMVIEQVKKLAKPGDHPMAYAKAPDNKLIVSLIALDKKYQTCLALEALRIASKSEEMVLVQEAWFTSNKKGDKIDCPPSESPNKKECFVVNYFSKEKCIVQMLEFERIKGPRKLKWINEVDYWAKEGEMEKCESRFNPFRFTEEDIKHFFEMSEQDKFRETGKKEVVKMLYNFHIDIYRKDNKAFLEVFNKQGEVFFATKISEDDNKFEKSIKDMKTALEMVGGLK